MIEGRKIFLKSLETPDLAAAFQILSRPDIWPWLTQDPADITMSNLPSLLGRSFTRVPAKVLGIYSKHDLSLIGVVTINDIDPINRTATIGSLAALKSGMVGLIYEKKILIDYLYKTLGLHKVRAYTWRKEMDKFFMKVGMTKEGTLKQESFINGAWCDKYIWGMINEEVCDGSSG